MSVDQAAVAAWVESTCAAQGVPVKVADPVALREVGVLLGAWAEGPRAHGARAPSTRASAQPLQPPSGLHPLGVQAVPSGGLGGQDRGVVEDSLDDGDLPGQVQPGPL